MAYSWELRDKIMGTVEQDTARIIVEEMNLPINSEQVQVELKKLQRETLKQAQLMPGNFVVCLSCDTLDSVSII